MIYLTQTAYTWWEEGCEIVEDLRVPLPSCETHHRAHIQREGPQLLPRAQAVHFQHVFHVVEEAHKQEAGVGAGGKHCGGRRGKVTTRISAAAQSRSFRRETVTGAAKAYQWHPCHAAGRALSSCLGPEKQSRCWWGDNVGRPGWSWTWTACPRWWHIRTRRQSCRWASPMAKGLNIQAFLIVHQRNTGKTNDHFTAATFPKL